MCVRMKKSLLLFALILFTGCPQPVFALRVSPELPVIYEGWNDGQVEVVVDLTPEEKAMLTGTGFISVAVTSPDFEVVSGALISIPYNGQETFPQSTTVLRKKAKYPRRDEEYRWGGYGFFATPVTAPGFVAETYLFVSVVGRHYESVKRYLTRAQIEFQDTVAAYGDYSTYLKNGGDRQAYERSVTVANQFKIQLTSSLSDLENSTS